MNLLIQFKNVSYEYAPSTPFAFDALNDVNVGFEKGKITAIIGPTGSGKSTLVQHLNGLNRPTSGSVHIIDHVLIPEEKTKRLKSLRAQVGLVFQFPEMQLFEVDVFTDVAFGPKNFGFSEDEIKSSVENALHLVGIEQSLWDKSPLDLSGGQKRRVAIAGVIASNPEVLVLDEPTAGLDPQGAAEMMALFVKLNKELGKTIIMVTHDMDHVLNYADDLLVMDQGKVHYTGPMMPYFLNIHNLTEKGFVPPKVLQLKEMLKQKNIDTGDYVDLKTISEIASKGGL